MRKYLRATAAMLGLLILLLATTGAAVSAEQAYAVNGVNVRYRDFSSSQNECWSYAYNFYNKIWGESLNSNFYSSDNLLRNRSKEELTLTPEHLREYVSKAVPGAVIRVSSSGCLYGSDSWGHSLVIVSIEDDGLTVFEGGLNAWPHCREHFYTWEEFCRTGWLGGRYGYIKYIKWPSASQAQQPNANKGESEAPILLETMEVAPAVVCEAGDLNNSGSIDAADYVMLKRFVSGTIRLNEAQLKGGDLNGDGQVDEQDFRLLRNQVYAERILPKISLSEMTSSLLHYLF